ncbi:MAG: hypothetical protein PHD82_16000, partial [Candidatus Riflebacteria bacterium]|nr:hypothetical protein [Candidatus Riflebacteria bacterium]
MTIRDIFSKIWPGKGSAEKQLKLLVKQIDSASEDLKIRIAESIASSAGLERKLEQCNKLSDSQKPQDERQEMLRQDIQAEKRLLEGLQTLFSELKNKSEEINIAIEQNLLRQRKA